MQYSWLEKNSSFGLIHYQAWFPMVPWLLLALIHLHLTLQKNYFPLKKEGDFFRGMSFILLWFVLSSFFFFFKDGGFVELSVSFWAPEKKCVSFYFYFIWDQEGWVYFFSTEKKNKIKCFGLSNLRPTLRSWVQPLSKKKNVRAEMHAISPNFLCLTLQEDG